MMNLLSTSYEEVKNLFSQIFQEAKQSLVIFVYLTLIAAILVSGKTSNPKPVLAQAPAPASTQAPLAHITPVKDSSEVFGFAPYWNINKLSNIDFKVLTTLAYFGVEVGSDGNLVKDSPGYNTFASSQATDLFRKAHSNNTRVVLTLTQMDNGSITQLMDDTNAQRTAIDQAVGLVKQRGIDGINVDFEFEGDPGQYYRDRFTQFVTDLTNRMHQEVPGSKVTVSVYATAVKDPKIYDIGALGKMSDGIFMMAYDFANAGSDNAIPTAPLYGYQDGKYWYDISTSVNDFLRLMPANKLILGVPYYGYNYVVDQPAVKAQTSWKGAGESEPYSLVANSWNLVLNGVDQVINGWDDDGKVGYFAYHIANTDTWRMVFMEDTKSLGIKYDFAKQKGLGGVGIWALGNDDGKPELWNLLEQKFGPKQLASADLTNKAVNNI